MVEEKRSRDLKCDMLGLVVKMYPASHCAVIFSCLLLMRVSMCEMRYYLNMWCDQCQN